MNIHDFYLYFLFGALGGTLSGLLGLGGGIIIVPALALLFYSAGFPSDTLMHLAIGTSLGAMITTAGTSTVFHLKQGANIWPTYRKLYTGIILGATTGALLANCFHSKILSTLFGIFALFVSFHILFNWKETFGTKVLSQKTMHCVSFLVGVKSGFFGVGGGVITLPFLSMCRTPLKDAIGTTAACSFTVAIFASLGFFLTGLSASNLPPGSIGYIYWPAVLGISLSSPLFTWLGASICHWLPIDILKKVFALILLLLAIRMMIGF